MKKRSLSFYIFLAILGGIVNGLAFGEAILPFVQPLSTIFLRSLKMIILPLIITSILSGVLGIGTAKGLGRLGLKTFSYFLVSSLLAIFIGQGLVNCIRPGDGADLGLSEKITELEAANQSLGDLVYRIIPENPFQALANGDVLPLIFFSILFGVFVTRISDPYKGQLTNLIQGAFEAMMKLTHFIILAAPVGIFAIITRVVATTGFAAFKALALYVFVVISGLILHSVVILPLLLKSVGRVSPWTHYRRMTSALLTAFSTSSSMGALPFTMENTINNAGVSKKVAGFVLPIGATVNMNGTALYECVTAIFIAQAYGIALSFGQQTIVVLTALLAAVGTAGIPMAGLVMTSIVLQSVGLPLEGIGIVLAVERILDMCRTTVNIFSDSCGAVIVARLEGEKLEVKTSAPIHRLFERGSGE
jgi:proton glutamate symport protein